VDRRRFVLILGGSLAALALAPLSACAPDKPKPKPSAGRKQVWLQGDKLHRSLWCKHDYLIRYNLEGKVYVYQLDDFYWGKDSWFTYNRVAIGYYESSRTEYGLIKLLEEKST